MICFIEGNGAMKNVRKTHVRYGSNGWNEDQTQKPVPSRTRMIMAKGKVYL